MTDELFPPYKIPAYVREAIINDCCDIQKNNCTVQDWAEDGDKYIEDLRQKSDEELLEYYLHWLGYKGGPSPFCYK